MHLNLLSAITQAPLPEYFLLTATDEEDAPLLAQPIKLNSINCDLLPARDYFLPRPVGDLLLSKEHAVIETSLELSEAKSAPVISSYTLAAFLEVFQDFLKFCFKSAISNFPSAKRKEISNPDYYTAQVCGIGAHASFTVQFRSKMMADLSQHVDLEFGLNKAETILAEIQNTTRTIEIMREHGGHWVRAYRRLLNFVIENRSSLRIRWHAPRDTEQTKRFYIGLEEAGRLHSALSKLKDLEAVIISLVGVVIQLHTETGAWTLQSEDGESHHGELEAGREISLAGITAKTKQYLFECREEIRQTPLGREVRELFLLNYAALPTEVT